MRSPNVGLLSFDMPHLSSMAIFARNPISSSLSSMGRKVLLRPDDNPKAALLEGESSFEVPKGFLAVYVGEHMKRYVMPTEYLCRPAFKELMERAAEVFGYEHEGGLRIPCDEEAFEETLKVMEQMRKDVKQEKKERKKKKERSVSMKLY